MGALPEEVVDGQSVSIDWSKTRAAEEIDPGWTLGKLCTRSAFDPVKSLAELPWWQAFSSSSAISEGFQRLWRHTVAVSLATRSLAREAGDPHPEFITHAGLLHGLGRWAVAAVDPEWIVRWLNEDDPRLRLAREQSDLGMELCELGRRLAERWGCDPLVVDAAWLHGHSIDALNQAAANPRRVSIIQEAFRWAENTPWSLSPAASRETMPTDPRLRILVAEVQSRCGSYFAAGDATFHEQQMTQRSARLMLRLTEAHRANASHDRLVEAMATSDLTESAETWANRAGMLWCAEPEVNSAQVVWLDQRTSESSAPDTELPGKDPAQRTLSSAKERPASFVLPLKSNGRALAEVHIWCGDSEPALRQRLATTTIVPAWEAWARLVAEREILEHRLQVIVSGVRRQAEENEARTRDAKLEALAEFAAGAGHELNNPLAVIVGRAQLLISRTHDPDTTRSLRIILAQAQRTHRILRDLMFVARPPAPRPRTCRPVEILRTCLAEFQEDCESRGIRLTCEVDLADVQSWSDPDGLFQLADILVRNAIQATPAGGKIQVRSGVQGSDLRWWFCDSGKGISATEGAHLFDPFFCGRQAGRGLGLGLPRAARIVALAGGTLQWNSTPGQGTTFQVQLPLSRAPEHSPGPVVSLASAQAG
jgi:signal transduction histidine kinase